VSGAVRLQLTPGASGPVVLRRFYFPAWDVRCDGVATPTFPVGRGRLLGFTSPPNGRGCEAQVSATPPEQLGVMLAGASLALLAGYAVWFASSAGPRRAIRATKPTA